MSGRNSWLSTWYHGLCFGSKLFLIFPQGAFYQEFLPNKPRSPRPAGSLAGRLSLRPKLPGVEKQNEPPATVANGSELATMPLPRASSAQATRPDGCNVAGICLMVSSAGL